jgi:hypothetical protein
MPFAGVKVAYFYPSAEVAKDAAIESNQLVFEEAGDLQLTSRTWASAQAFAGMNNGYLAQYGVHAVVTGISVDA